MWWRQKEEEEGEEAGVGGEKEERRGVGGGEGERGRGGEKEAERGEEKKRRRRKKRRRGGGEAEEEEKEDPVIVYADDVLRFDDGRRVTTLSSGAAPGRSAAAERPRARHRQEVGVAAAAAVRRRGGQDGSRRRHYGERALAVGRLVIRRRNVRRNGDRRDVNEAGRIGRGWPSAVEIFVVVVADFHRDGDVQRLAGSGPLQTALGSRSALDCIRQHVGGFGSTLFCLQFDRSWLATARVRRRTFAVIRFVGHQLLFLEFQVLVVAG